MDQVCLKHHLLPFPRGWRCWRCSVAVTRSPARVQSCSQALQAAFLSLAPAPKLAKGAAGVGWCEEQQFQLSPAAHGRAGSPLTSGAPTPPLNSACSPGLGSADAGALPSCEGRGWELPSPPQCLLPREAAAPFVSPCPAPSRVCSSS